MEPTAVSQPPAPCPHGYRNALAGSLRRMARAHGQAGALAQSAAHRTRTH
ncbi:hypothetical protein [Acidovorax sp.]